MVDNWSSSVITLTSPGDWAKWTMTVPDSTTRDQLNGDGAGLFRDFLIRGAFGAASLSGYGTLIVNDRVAINIGNPTEWFGSDASWISANRFQLAAIAAQGFQAWGFPDANFVSAHGTVTVADGPFVVGTNTIRFLWYGTFAGASRAFELDFVFAIADGRYATIIGTSGAAYTLGDDDIAEAKPADFDSHANPNPVAATSPMAWLLKSTEATTGTAEAASFELLRLCPTGPNLFHVRFRITYSNGAPASGEVGMSANAGTGSPTYVNLDANGRASFTNVSSDGGGTNFWYGGNDNLGPLAYIPDYDVPKCGGWHVGRIGVG